MTAPSNDTLTGRRDIVHDIVREAFETALGISGASDEDDFFDLGGDSLMALSFLMHIEDQLGQALPITALYDTTTIAALTDRLLHGFPGRSDRTLVELRPAQTPHPGVPLFMLHGLGGSVMVLRDLAKSLGGRRAVWGIEAPGLDGQTAPLASVSAMAEDAIGRIKRVAARGPYLLAGYSFGGLIALEIARRLRADGEQVALLAMLDTFPHPRTWRPSVRLRAFLRQVNVYFSLTVWTRLVKREIGKLRGHSAWQITRRLARGAMRAVTLPADVMGTAWVYDVAGRAPRPEDMLPPLDRGAMTAANYETIEQVTNAAKCAFAEYRPAPYDGDLLVLHATERQIVPFDPRAVWAHLVRNLTVIDLPTDHQALVRGAARATAAELTRAIAASLQQGAA
jgi:acetoacetyl-CoA synthetase